MSRKAPCRYDLTKLLRSIAKLITSIAVLLHAIPLLPTLRPLNAPGSACEASVPLAASAHQRAGPCRSPRLVARQDI